MTISLIELHNIREDQRRAQERAEAKRALKLLNRKPPTDLDEHVKTALSSLKSFEEQLTWLAQMGETDAILSSASPKWKQRLFDCWQRTASLMERMIALDQLISAKREERPALLLPPAKRLKTRARRHA